MKFRLWLLLSIVACGISWLYVQRILDPWSVSTDAKKGALTAELGDLYPRWLGTRELLLHGINPYGAEVSAKIQVAYYGHALAQDLQPGHPIIDEQRFAYPIYVVFLMAPSARFDFATVHRWAPSILAFLVGLGVILCLDLLHWPLPWEATVALVLFTISSPQIIQGLRLRQLGLLVGFLAVLAAWCVSKNLLATAGMVLAICTIKPQMIVLPLLWFLIWTLGRWRERWRLMAGFCGGLAALAGLGEFVMPGWFGYFTSGLRAYMRYVPATSLLNIVLGKWLTYVISALLIAALLWWAWRRRGVAGTSQDFTFALGAFLVVETIALPLLPPFNQVLLLLPAVMIFKDWRNQSRFLRAAFLCCLSWPWIASLGLVIMGTRTHSWDQAALLPATAAVLVPFLLLLLGGKDWRRAPA